MVDIEGATGTLYEGERFQLGFKFTSRYPFDSPQVCFSVKFVSVYCCRGCLFELILNDIKLIGHISRTG